MRWRRLALGSAKWGCSAAALLVVGVFVASRWYALEFLLTDPGADADGSSVQLICRLIAIRCGGVLDARFVPPRILNDDVTGGFMVEKEDEPRWIWKPERSGAAQHPSAFVPLWIPLLPLALAAGALWYPDVRLAR